MASRPANDGSTLRLRIGGRTVIAALVSGPIMGYGTYWFASDQFGFGTGLTEFYAAFAVPFLLILALLNMVVFLGIASSEVDDSALEWWSRTCGWIAIAAVLWAGAGFLVFYTADWIEAGVKAITSYFEVDHGTASALLTVVVPLFSSMAGLAARGGGTSKLEAGDAEGGACRWSSCCSWLRSHGPISRLGPGTSKQTAGVPPCATEGPVVNPVLRTGRGARSGRDPVRQLAAVRLDHELVRAGQSLLVARHVSAAADSNLPRRLAAQSASQPFTGFDSKDDLLVHHLADVRPLHVINTTLNAVSSTHVGRHETKAQSFTFSPLHVGNHHLGYRPAAEYGSDRGARGTGVSLGMALAISGAAASPAMGMYSTKARAFLLTLANARLGVWFGNPEKRP